MAQGTEEAEPLRHAAASDRRTAGAPTPEPSGNASGDVCAALASLLRGVLHIGPGSSGFKRPQYARVHADASSGLPGYDESGVLSRTVFAFVSALLLQGSKRQLSADDLFPPPAQFNAREAADAIEEPLLYELHHHGGEAKRRVPLTARALWRSFKFSFLRTAAFKLLNDVVGALPPLIMGALLAYLSNEPSESRVNVFNANSTAAGYALAVALFIVPITKTIIEQQYFYRAQLLNIAFKTGLTTLVYRKAVRLSVASKQGTTSGEVMNHMQLDAFKVGDLMTYFNVLWSGLVQIALYLGLINLYIGVSAFGGFGALLLIIPVQLWAFRLINRMRSKQMHHADLRVKQQNECLSGIKIIKLNAWEDPVGKQALDQRAEEVKWLRRVALVQGFITALMWTAPVIVALCAFTIYSIGLNGAMTASRVFPSLVLFNQLRFPVIFYPRVLNQIADALVALRRLGRFFSLDEADPNAPAKEQTLLQLRVGDEAVVCHDASFHFCKLEDEEDTRNKRVPFLQCVGITLRMGELSCVVGTVGSGKTSIALALLGELHQCSGSPVRVNGRVAYASQSAWIQNGTLRENILFGSPMNRDLYEKVLRATCLKDDVDSLQNGDQTEIGEKGVTLSGGQKQRVALARAAFADADIYVLDDPLSALDATVGKQVFNELICGLLNEKAVLLTTHALHLLDKADTVIVMESGSVVQQGSYEELMRHKKEGDTFARLAEEHGSISEDTEGGLFSTSMNSPRAPVDKRALRRSRSSGTILSFVKKDRNRGGNTNASSTDEDDDTAAATTSNAGSESGSEDSRENRLYEDASMTHNEKSGLQKDTKEASDGAQAAKGKASSGGLVKEEHREEGTVQLGVYLEYLRAYPGGFVMATIVFIIVIMRQVGSVGQMYWLSVWSEQTTGEQKDQTEWGSMQYLTVYGLMAAGVGVVTYCSSISFWLCGLTAARKLHLNLFSSILAARMRFFDETPHGRVLQRFQKDTDVLDNQVPQTLSTVAQFFCQLACILLIMSYAQPLLFPFFFPVGALYYYVQRFFRASYREVKRLESVLASPVYAHFSETLDGLATVRAFGRQEEFKRENMNRVLENQRAFYAQRCCCDRWLPVRLETIGNSFVLLTGVLGVMLHDSNVDALKTYTSLVGLLLTYSLEMTSLLNWLVRQGSELESQMVSMERIYEYTNNVEKEEQLDQTMTTPMKNDWPSEGDVHVSNLQLRYIADSPLALKSVSFHVPPGSKLGVVGRTGSGKSSLIAALWRLVEPCGGSIVIDGVDITKLRLADLRSRVTCIPQDAVLFSGTIRYNLDPYEWHNDHELWQALDSVQLREVISSLYAEVVEFGANYSEGQKQLLCLARAMLRRSKVVALDEATASVDAQTDALIQNTIGREFAHATTITIAHRLHTVIESDLVLVLDKGYCIECAHPSELLSDSTSAFSAFVDEHGEASANLRERARRQRNSGQQ